MHQTLKKRALLEKYYLPGDLDAQIEGIAEHYNHQRNHESLNKVTLSDACFGKNKQSSSNAKGSNKKALNIGACITAKSPHNINQQINSNTHLFLAALCLKLSDDGHLK